MLKKISKLLQKYATGKVILAFFVLVLIFQGIIVPNLLVTPLANLSGGKGPMDLMMSYTPQTALSLIQSYGQAGRAAYLSFATSWDVAYPIIYSIFFALILTWLLQRAFLPNSKMQLFNVVPLGGWIFDWLENMGIATMLSQYPNFSQTTANLASACTSIKWGFAVMSTVLVTISFIGALKNKFKRQ